MELWEILKEGDPKEVLYCKVGKIEYLISKSEKLILKKEDKDIEIKKIDSDDIESFIGITKKWVLVQQNSDEDYYSMYNIEDLIFNPHADPIIDHIKIEL